jgi:hypothetical protein
MTAAARKLIATFDGLSYDEKQTVAAEILRRSLDVPLPPIVDEDLVHCAEEIFLDYDRREAADEESAAR